MAAIPSGLGPQNDGFTISGLHGVHRVMVGGGLPRYGLDYARGLQQYSIRMVLTEVEFTVWSAFYHRVLTEGSAAITLPLDGGFGVESREVHIVPGSYGYRRVAGDKTEVTFQVEGPTAAYDLTEAEALDLIADFEAANGDLLEALRPMVQEYSADGPDGAWRSDVAGGAPGYAAQWERSCQRHQVVMLLDAGQYAAWSAYLHHVIGKGAYPFSMYLDSGFGPAEHTVHILPDSYSATRRGPRTAVRFVAEAQSAMYALTSTEASDLVLIWNDVGNDMDELFARIAQFANVDTLVLDL